MNYNPTRKISIQMKKSRTALIPGLLCTTALTAQAQTPFGEFSEPDFPFHTCTLNLSEFAEAQKGGLQFPALNQVPRAIVLKLGNGRHVCWDPDLLRMAGWWEGGFVEMQGMASFSYHPDKAKTKVSPGTKKVPRIEGQLRLANRVAPGWTTGESPSFNDPRPPAPIPAEKGLGALPLSMGKWNGLYRSGSKIVLSYDVAGIPIEENYDTGEELADHTLCRNFRTLTQTSENLHLAIATIPGASPLTYDKEKKLTFTRHGKGGNMVTAFGILGPNKAIQVNAKDNHHIYLTIPKGTQPTLFKLIVWQGMESDLKALGYLSNNNIQTPNPKQGGSSLWPDTEVTEIPQAEPNKAELATSIKSETIPLPIPNRWKRNVRPVSVTPWKKHAHAALTFDGDVWIMLEGKSPSKPFIKWKRYASGLHEPLSIESQDGQLIVFSRNGLIRLHDFNNDMEADFYENLSNQFTQTIETREYANSLELLPGGKGFLIVKGGIQAGSQGIHNNHLLQISPDGKTATSLASGLREGFVAAHPTNGEIYATDQQGNWIPSTPIHLVKPGDFYGFQMPAREGGFPATAEPICWIPHASARSGTDIFWTPEDFGEFPGQMFLVDYYRPGILQVFVDRSDPKQFQGASRLLPLEFKHPLLKASTDPETKQIYLAGMQIFGSVAPEIGGITRLSAISAPSFQPTGARVTQGGILLSFNQPLDFTKATQADIVLKRWNYQRTEKYGSGHFKLDGSPGAEMLGKSAVYVSPDLKSLFIAIPGMKPVHTLEAAFKLSSQKGMSLEDTIWLTAHHLPVFDIEKEGYFKVPLRVARNEDNGTKAPASAKEGEKLYTTLGCIACHSLDGTQGKRPGPSFKGLPGSQRKLADNSTVTADEAYLRESILQPDAKTIEGFQDSEVRMPPYLGILDQQQLDSLVLFLMGQTGEVQ